MTIRRTIMEPNFDSVLNPASGGDAAELTIAIRVGLRAARPEGRRVAACAFEPGTGLTRARGG